MAENEPIADKAGVEAMVLEVGRKAEAMVPTMARQELKKHYKGSCNGKL